MKQKANHAGVKPWDGNSSYSEEVGLTMCYMSSVCEQNGWIVDSGATSHMCKDHRHFTEMHTLDKPLEIMLGMDMPWKQLAKGS